jgi:feruloyl esterase
MGSDYKLAAAIVCAASMMTGASSDAAELAQDRRICTTTHFASLASPPVHIESASHTSATAEVPAHCFVVGFIEHGTRIGFAVGLPDDWNNKSLFLGIGGFAGVLAPLHSGIAKRYATATTDTGHKGASIEDTTWALNNPAALINHYETSVELAARAAKGLTAAYYGAPPARSYFQGCSAGGRQGLVEAQRFPGTFDGIVAEAPAWNYMKLLISFVENGKEVLKSPDNWVPPESFAEIDRVVMQQCDQLDGVEDAIISDPRQCKADLRPLLCKAGTKTQSCLAPAQLRTLGKLIQPDFARKRPGYFGLHLTGTDRSAGPSWGWSEWIFGTRRSLPDSSGKLNFARNVLPEGADRGNGPNQFVLGEQFFRHMVMNDPGFDARSFNIDTDATKVEAAMGDLLNADDTDLGRFVRSGGKLLIWHGWADPAIPPDMAIDLHARIRRDTKQQAGQAPIDEAVRLFMVPGVQHCGGGSGLTQFDPLAALEQWVEQGRAPDRIVASQLIDGKPARSRPLCPYPKVARYRGTGNVDAADSFDCK